LRYAQSLDPALTTVRIDGTALGSKAAGFIIDRIEGRPVPQPVLDLGFSIIPRDSA
jgi:LacI family gluconate utilization system Gnt-I transcriptional repressor